MVSETMITELVRGIKSTLGGNVLQIILYGSVARENDSEESDVDVAVLILKKMDIATEDKLSDVIVELNLKYDKVFSVIDIENELFNKWRNPNPFYRNVEEEGIVLWKAA